MVKDFIRICLFIIIFMIISIPIIFLFAKYILWWGSIVRLLD